MTKLTEAQVTCFEQHLTVLRDNLAALGDGAKDQELGRAFYNRSRGVNLALEALYIVMDEEKEKPVPPPVQNIHTVSMVDAPKWLIDLDAEKEKQ